MVQAIFVHECNKMNKDSKYIKSILDYIDFRAIYCILVKNDEYPSGENIIFLSQEEEKYYLSEFELYDDINFSLHRISMISRKHRKNDNGESSVQSEDVLECI